MKWENKIAGVLLAVFSGLSGCEKNITVKQLPYASKLSIQCLLKPGEYPVLYLYRTVPYFDPKITNRDLFVRNAMVDITSPSGTDSMTADSLFNFFTCGMDYFYKGKIKTAANTKYALSIEQDGLSYNASTVTDEAIVQIDSINYVSSFKDIYGDHEGIIVHFKDNPNQENFYRYEMSRIIDSSIYHAASNVHSVCTNGQKFTVMEIGRTVYADKGLNGASLVFTFEPAYTHKKGDIAYLRLESMDKNSFNFYDQLDKQKLAEFNPFVEPVFIKPGQFNNAIGVFGSYVVSDSVKFVYPE